MGKRKRKEKRPPCKVEVTLVQPPVAQPDVPAEQMSQETYLRERGLLVDLETKSSEHHDRAALMLSAGALALSITFIQNVAPSPLPGSLWMIGFAWTSFIVSITAVLVSFQMSQKACRRQREVIDQIYETGDATGVDQANAYSLWTERANYISFTAFLIGVGLLAAFAFTNLPR